jgi:hypothetical protein
MISVILYGRNDAHGYNLHRRAALSLNCLAEVLTHPEDEILFVDYNTPDELPTFVEALSDTLTDRCLALLRVLRVPAAIHTYRFASRTHLSVVEPVARNVAVRRMNPSNPWLLSTNTDMILLPLADTNLSEVCRTLPQGFYGLPRFELPEWVWERLPRNDPARALTKISRLGPELMLDESTVSHEWIRFDAPGDFQLMLRDDFLAIDGFDEEMILGWHVDSNLSRRMFLHRGRIETLEDRIAGYHCNHFRIPTIYRWPVGVANDLHRFFFSVEQAEIRSQRATWGLADLSVEEISICERIDDSIFRAVTAARPGTMRGHGSSDAAIAGLGVTYDSAHVLPFIADTLVVSQVDTTIAYVGVNRVLRQMLLALVAELKFASPLAVARLEDVRSVDEAAENADVFIIDLGIDVSLVEQNLSEARSEPSDEWASALDRTFIALERVVEVERGRLESGEHPRRFVLVNGSTVSWGPYVIAQFDCSSTSVHSRVQRATVKKLQERTTNVALARARQIARWSFGRTTACGRLQLRPRATVGLAQLDDFAGIRQGWALPDDSGIWTEGPRSELAITLGGTDGQEFRLALDVDSVCAGPPDALKMDAFVNGVHAMSWDSTQFSPDLPMRVPLPRDVLIDDDVDLTLMIEEPRSPFALGWSRDPRLLGVHLRSITLEEVDRSVRLGERVVFAQGSGSERLLGQGWSVLDGTGVWSIGDRARLILRVTPSHGECVRDCYLALRVDTVCVGPDERLKVEALVNGVHAANWDSTQFHPDLPVRVPVPQSELADGGVDLTLLIDEPRSPLALGRSRDDRPLGIHLHSLTIEEVDRSIGDGETLLFGHGLGSERLLGEGWSVPDPTGVWTVGDKASLLLRFACTPLTDLDVILGVTPFVTPDHAELVVEFSMGGEQIGRRVFSRQTDSPVRLSLSAVVRAAAAPTVLELHLLDPARPVDLGLSPDARPLGVHLESISVRKIGWQRYVHKVRDISRSTLRARLSDPSRGLKS